MKPPAELNPKKNPWDKVVSDLKVDSEGIAKFQDAEFVTAKGVVKSQKIKDGIIH